MALRFLLRCVVWSLPIVIGLTGYVLWNRDHVPAPRYTGNVALNEQVYRIAQLPKGSTDILAVGSSMTLNNLASTPVTEHFGSAAYVNSGAWGMGIMESIVIIPDLVDRLGPSTILMVTNLMDMKPGSALNESERLAVQRCLEEGGSMWDYFRYWDAPWFLRQMDLNRIRFSDPGNYEFLGFDDHGAATLEVPADRILRSRYDEKPPSAKDLDEMAYALLEKVSLWSREEGIDLIVMQSPYRKGLLTGSLRELNKQHAARMKEILRASGHQFVDGNALEWPDSLFNDASHLDRAGAHAFTAWALQQLKQ